VDIHFTLHKVLKLSRFKMDCFICMEQFANSAGETHSPVALPCGHTICSECFDKLQNATKSCPYCERAMGKTKTFNYALIHLVGEMTAASTITADADTAAADAHATPLCVECEGSNPVEIVCQTCSLVACKACSDQIHSSVARQKHQRTPWTADYIDPKGLMCKQHPTYSCDLLCLTCSKQSICMMCYNFGAHKEHNVRPVDDVVKNCRKQLLRMAGVLNQEISHASDAIILVDQQITKIRTQTAMHAEAKINAEFKLLADAVEKRRAEMVAEANSLWDRKIQVLNAQKETLNEFVGRSIASSSRAQSLLSHQNNYYFCSQLTDAVSGLTQAASIKRCYECMASSEVVIQLEAFRDYGCDHIANATTNAHGELGYFPTRENRQIVGMKRQTFTVWVKGKIGKTYNFKGTAAVGQEEVTVQVGWGFNKSGCYVEGGQFHYNRKGEVTPTLAGCYYNEYGEYVEDCGASVSDLGPGKLTEVQMTGLELQVGQMIEEVAGGDDDEDNDSGGDEDSSDSSDSDDEE
jgi:hypothetical protein